jgi:hypothetical protein
MWLQAGQRSRCVQDALGPAGLPATGSASGSPRLNRPSCASVRSHWRPIWSRLSGGSHRQSRAGVRPAIKAARSLPRLICVAVLCLLMLPSCSVLRPPLPAATQAKPEPLRCLDRLMLPCPGVDDVTPTTCADAVVLAVDGLTALASCQDRHGELVRCVEAYQERNR